MDSHRSPASSPLEALVPLALGGDKRALSELCRGLQGPVYRLSVRMLGDLHDAQDATQEILVQVITHLAQFEGRSRLLTWVYTIASRHLLRVRVSRREQRGYRTDSVARSIDEGLAVTEPSAEPVGDVVLLERELRFTCTQAMLLCLSREERLALILTDVLGATDALGAQICEVTPAAFRKRLQRARAELRPLMEERCGLVDAANACRCKRQASAMQRHRSLNVDWAKQPVERREQLVRANGQLSELVRAGAVLAIEPPLAAPDQLLPELIRMFPDLLS